MSMHRTFLVAAAALAALAPTVQAQEVKVTGNIGWVSEYIFRGIPQKASSASAGLDLVAGPVTVGTWGADVGDGNEVDVYGKFAIPAGDFSVSVGATGYFYTGDFDNTYVEGNLDLGYGPVSAALAVGTHDANPSATYWYLGGTVKHKGFSLTIGHFAYDNDAASTGNFGRLAYDFSIPNVADLSLAWLMNDEVLSGMGRADNTLVFGVVKTFSIK